MAQPDLKREKIHVQDFQSNAPSVLQYLENDLIQMEELCVEKNSDQNHRCSYLKCWIPNQLFYQQPIEF